MVVVLLTRKEYGFAVHYFTNLYEIFKVNV